MNSAPHPRSYFSGWVDDFTFIERAHNKVYVRDALAGTVLKSAYVDGNIVSGPYYKLPPWAPAPFISIHRGGVYFVKQDFRPGKAIYIPPQGGPVAEPDFRVDVDPGGDWVAFTIMVKGAYKTAIKRMGDPAEAQPIIISPVGPPTMTAGNGHFQTWTGRNELLHMNWDTLTVMDRDGNVIRRTFIPESMIDHNASFRKFMHY
jgi:hypothetical protein